MKILYLIGNGFDLHVGLRTGYQHFLKYYLDQPIPSDVDEVGQRFIKRLKQSIGNDITLWSDLEIEYGKHMAKLGSVGSAVHSVEDEFDIINDDIRTHLSKYIAKEDERSFFTEDAKKSFVADITSPYKNLLDYHQANIQNRRRRGWSGSSNIIDIISFNYTRTIEHLLGKMPLQTGGFEFHEPIHVHGYHNSRMVFGVNDLSQIGNEELRKSTYIKDALVKSSNNHTYGDNHTNTCKDLIKDAQLICCYGLSFGDTDKMWWEKVCEAMMNNGDIITVLFSHSDRIIDFANSGHKIERLKRRIKDQFLSKGGLKEPAKQSVSERIFVSINNPIFNIQIDDRTEMDKLMGKSAPGTVQRFVEMADAIRNNKA